jgi:hypothetical protein
VAKEQKPQRKKSKKSKTSKTSNTTKKTRKAQTPARWATAGRVAEIESVAAMAAEATCLEMPAAVALVKGCVGGTLPALDTKLGDLFPDPDARSQFCQCVADGSGVSRARIPCGEGTTVGEVIDAIAC